MNSTNSINPTDSMDPPYPDRFRNPLARMLKLLAALVFLNAVLNMDAAIPGETRTSFLQLAPELLVLTIGVSLWVRRHARFRPAFYAPVAAAVIFLGLFRLVDNLIPMVFNRPFSLYLDIRRLPDLVLLGWMLLSPAYFALASAGVALALPAVAWAAYRCLNILHDGLRTIGLKSVLACLTAGAIAAGLWSAFRPDDAPALVGSATLPRVAEEMRAILDLDDIRRGDQAAIAAAIERSRHTPTNLKAPEPHLGVPLRGRILRADRVLRPGSRRAGSTRGEGRRSRPAGRRVPDVLGLPGLPDLWRYLLARPRHPGKRRAPEQPDPARPAARIRPRAAGRVFQPGRLPNRLRHARNPLAIAGRQIFPIPADGQRRGFRLQGA